MTTSATLPSADARRAAVCDALAASPRLLRFAARITRDLDDAEDAYQRAMEIALRSAPVVEADRFMAWLRTVLRNEAIAIAQKRRREGPGMREDAALTADRTERPHVALDEWRHRYQTVSEAFVHLSDAQRVCLVLQAGGASYADIIHATGFSRRKVERSILEGREVLRRWEGHIASGEACVRLRPGLEDVVTGIADRSTARAVEHHVRHCGHCRGALRTGRQRRAALGTLAPVCLLPQAGDVPPDAELATAWMSRMLLSASVRAGNGLQMVLDAPGPMVAKGAAALAAAGVAVGVALPALQTSPPPGSPPAALAQVIGASDAAPPPARPAPAAPSVTVPQAPRATRAPRAVAVIPRVATPRVPTDLTRVAGYARRPAPRAPAFRATPSSTPAAAPTSPAMGTPAPIRAASAGAAPRVAPRAPTRSPSRSTDAAGAASISVGPSGP